MGIHVQGLEWEGSRRRQILMKNDPVPLLQPVTCLEAVPCVTLCQLLGCRGCGEISRYHKEGSDSTLGTFSLCRWPL